ncbi:MAG: PIN domain-containing protein [Candidatus Hydrogenedentes bacterium]|nr:PIN domain-containing protein [Candidatus Hydrogenedentota bacterium]
MNCSMRMRWLLRKARPVETLDRDWETTGNLMRRLREQGITVPLTDALIATVAKRNGIAVLTADDHFRHLGVDVYAPSDDH